MAAPTIVWNGNTITLPRAFTAWTHTVDTDTVWRMSIDGHKRSHHRRHLWRCHLLYKQLTLASEMQLLTWWSWASVGGVYAVAKDGSKTLNTALSAAAPVGQASIPLLTLTGVTAGDVLILTSAERTQYEIVTVQTVGATVTATATLKRSFAAGDTCRHLFYYPRVTSKDSDYPVAADSEGTSNSLNFDHVIEEDLE